MSVSPGMIIAVVRAAVRVYHAGDRALSQHVRDRAHNIPNADAIGILYADDAAKIKDAYDGDRPPGFKQFIDGNTDDKPLREAIQALKNGDNSHLGLLVVARNNFVLKDKAKASIAAGEVPNEDVFYETIFTASIANWDKNDSNRPVTPWMRFALSLADVGLEFVASNPSVLGIGGNGEKLIGAFATSVSGLIPDDGSFGKQETLGIRVLGIVARAGLTTFADHAGAIIEEEHLRELIENVSKPIIASFGQADFATSVKWQAVTDAMLGPAAQAAFETLAKHQRAFLGDKFDTEETVGALTHAFLKTLATQQLADGITQEDALAIYKAALGVIAERPELFAGKDTEAKDVFFRNLLQKVSTAAQGLQPPLSKNFAASVTAVALESLQGSIGALVNVTGEPNWEVAIDRSLESVVGGLKDGVAAGGKFDKLFSKQQLTDVARVFLDQIAKTPGMIAGDGTEVRNIVSGVARAMAADTQLLLSGDDWIEIAAVAAEEAASNPGRLFGLNQDSGAAGHAELALKQLLANAATDLRTARNDGAVRFGDTLKRSMIATLRGLASDSVSAARALANDKLKSLVAQLDELVKMKDENGRSLFGAKEWLVLYHRMLERLIETGNLETLLEGGQITPDGKQLIESILKEKP